MTIDQPDGPLPLIDCWMHYVHYVRDDQDVPGLTWPAGFYMPIPKDPATRTRLGMDDDPEVQKFLASLQ